MQQGVIKLKVGKGVCRSQAQQYSSSAAMANSNASGSPMQQLAYRQARSNSPIITYPRDGVQFVRSVQNRWRNAQRIPSGFRRHNRKKRIEELFGSMSWKRQKRRQRK